MTTARIEPEHITGRIEALLAELPEDDELAEGDIDSVARQLAAAHDMLVHALESVEKG